ncbi:hypothetical protein [Moraxella lacunata]|uniref:hypothetical protein n=1 Tax=Moraxella lacunata TaxID=477 RepID=UPI003EDEE0ED
MPEELSISTILLIIAHKLRGLLMSISLVKLKSPDHHQHPNNNKQHPNRQVNQHHPVFSKTIPILRNKGIR